MFRTAAIHLSWSAAVAAFLVLPSVAGAANLQLEANDEGEIAITARNAPVVDTLQAMGEEAGFEVFAARTDKRPPVNLQMQDAPVEDVLREILRGRNYALIYDEQDVSQVILLEPSKPGPSRPAAPPRRAARGKARGKAAPAPIVIRN